jgi:hypothetical protein
MKSPFLLFCALLLSACQTLPPAPTTGRIVTDDVHRFWRAYDRAAQVQSPDERERIFREQYFDAGTPGLHDYQEKKIGTAADFAEFVSTHRRYYDGVRAETLRIDERLPRIRASLVKLKDLYPDAVYPDISFVIGRLSSGGTTSERGLLIGTEMYSITPDTPLDELAPGIRRIIGSAEVLPHTVVHELVHFQQQKVGGKETLLFGTLIEGGAEFVADLVLPAPQKPYFREWGEQHARAVRERFAREKDSEDWSGWIGNNSRATDEWPADLGYYVGYEIARGYYERASDKRQAVRDLLTFQDAEAILRASGYEVP